MKVSIAGIDVVTVSQLRAIWPGTELATGHFANDFIITFGDTKEITTTVARRIKIAKLQNPASAMHIASTAITAAPARAQPALSSYTAAVTASRVDAPSASGQALSSVVDPPVAQLTKRVAEEDRAAVAELIELIHSWVNRRLSLTYKLKVVVRPTTYDIVVSDVENAHAGMIADLDETGSRSVEIEVNIEYGCITIRMQKNTPTLQ